MDDHGQIHDYPARVAAYKARMAALKIQRLYRGVLGRRKYRFVYMQKRLKGIRQVSSRRHHSAGLYFLCMYLIP